MNPQDEINEIKERLDRLEQIVFSVGSQNEGDESQESNSNVMQEAGDGHTPSYELTSFQVKKNHNEYGWAEYAFKLGVRNNTGNALSFFARIIFLDSDEFEVCDDLTAPFTVEPDSEFIKTGVASITDDGYRDRIADVTAEVRCHG